MNTLRLTFGVLHFLTIFQLTAQLIPITINSNDTFQLATFMSDSSGKTYKINQYTSQDTSPKKTINPQPNFTWYTFDTNGYKGGNKITRTIKSAVKNGKPFSFKTYEHLFIDEKGTGTDKGFAATATLRTVNAPQGTFKILGVNQATGEINKTVGFIVTVE